MATAVIPSANPRPPVVSRDGAAEYLGIRPQTLAVWKSTGRYNLPVIKVGRRVMYRIADLDAFLARNTVNCGAANS